MASQDDLALLKQMYERGEISDEQYDTLRRHVLWGTPLPALIDDPDVGPPTQTWTPPPDLTPGRRPPAGSGPPDPGRVPPAYTDPSTRPPVRRDPSARPAPGYDELPAAYRDPSARPAPGYGEPPARPASYGEPPARPAGYGERPGRERAPDGDRPSWAPPADRGAAPPWTNRDDADQRGRAPEPADPRRSRRDDRTTWSAPPDAPARGRRDERALPGEPRDPRSSRPETAGPRSGRPGTADPDDGRPGTADPRRGRAERDAGREVWGPGAAEVDEAPVWDGVEEDEDWAQPAHGGGRRRRAPRLLAIATSMVLALALVAAGVWWFVFRETGVAPADYARAVCSSVRDWQQGVDGRSSTLVNSINQQEDRTAVRTAVKTYYGDLADRTDGLRTAITGAGTVDGGKAYADSFTGVVGDQATALRDLATRADRLDPASPSVFQIELQTLLNGAQTSVGKVTAALARPPAGIPTPLRTALSTEPSCAPYVG